MESSGGEVEQWEMARRVVICCNTLQHFGCAPDLKSTTDQPHL